MRNHWIINVVRAVTSALSHALLAFRCPFISHSYLNSQRCLSVVFTLLFSVDSFFFHFLSTAEILLI